MAYPSLPVSENNHVDQRLFGLKSNHATAEKITLRLRADKSGLSASDMVLRDAIVLNSIYADQESK